jgi:hypothetical protein
MMESIKRAVLSPIGDKDLWDAESQLEPEAEADFEFDGEDTTLVTPTVTSVYTHNSTSGVEYQASLVRAAIEQGGRFHDHQIPLPWLRRILAGLEGREVGPEEVWREDDPTAPAPPPAGPQPPSFHELFPAERDAAGPPQF